MTARAWRIAALILWFHHVITDSMPWFLDNWGDTWGVIAGASFGLLATLVVLVPVRDRKRANDRC